MHNFLAINLLQLPSLTKVHNRHVYYGEVPGYCNQKCNICHLLTKCRVKILTWHVLQPSVQIGTCYKIQSIQRWSRQENPTTLLQLHQITTHSIA